MEKYWQVRNAIKINLGGFMSKKKRGGFYNPQEKRTEMTAFVIVNKIQGYTEEEVLLSIFQYDQDPFIRKLINEMEYIFLDAVANPERFKANLHQAFLKEAQNILEQNKVREFFEYVLTMQAKLASKEVSGNISDAYYDMMIQLSTYLVPYNKIIVGISPDGKPITVNEIYPNLDKILYECHVKANHRGLSADDFIDLSVKELRRNGYPNVDCIADIDLLLMEERLITNMFFLVTLFVDSKDSPLLQKPYIHPAMNDFSFPLKHFYTKELKEHLTNRKRLLPSNGITVSFNDDSCFGEIYLKEKFVLDALHLAYRVSINGRNITGYYNTKTQYFCSVFGESAQGSKIDVKAVHKRIENYILEAYALLTTEIESNICLYTSDTKDHHTTGKHKSYKIDRNKLTKTNTEVDAYIRKLPLGATASEEAVSLAEKYGIKLNPDETFVRPFVKTVHRKEN